ncbi:hypothetical protein ACTFIZ_000415 [Dictyostelium cf. discoideum]
MSKVIHVNSNEELGRQLKDARVVIDFSAEWLISPVFEKLSKEYPTVKFIHVDIDKLNTHPLVKTIRSVPHFEFFVNESKVAEFSGANENLLRTKLDELK